MAKSIKPVRKDGEGRTTRKKYSYNYNYRYSYGYGYGYYGYSGYHKERRPRELNRTVLISTILFLLVGGTALYFWHDYQITRLSDSLLAHGDTMAAEEKWAEASDAYYRVWLIKKEPELLGKFTPAYDKFAIGHNRSGVIDSYHRALGALPKRTDMRLRLTELLLSEGQHNQAYEQAEKAVQAEPNNAEAIKLRALALMQLHRSGKPVENINALEELQRAYLQQPGDFNFAVSLVNYIRVDLGAENGSDLARQADAVFDHMVAGNPDDPNVYLARHRYRQKYGLKGAKADIDQAVALSPENPVVIQQAAWDALREAVANNSTSAYLAARQLFTNLIKLEPENPSGYLGLGDTEYLARGDIDEALEVWRKGREESGDNVPLLLRIIEAETTTFRHDEAEKTLDDLEAFQATLSGPEADATRDWANASSALFRAKILLARKQLVEALPLLDKAVRSGNAPVPGLGKRNPTAFTALIERGKAYMSLGRKQEAAMSFDQALIIKPDSEVALASSAKVWAELNDLDRAVRHVERALRSPKAPKEVNRDLAKYLFERELSLPKHERDWSEFKSKFEIAQRQLPSSWQLRFLDVDYSIRSSGDDLSRTLGKLLSIERDFPKNEDVWRRLPLVYESIGRTTDADRTLNRLEELTNSSAATKVLLADILLYRGKNSDAQKVLDGVPEEQLTSSEKWDRDLALLRVVEAVGDAAAIDERLRTLAEKYPANAWLVERQIERRISGASKEDSPSVGDLIGQLKTKKGADGRWQYYEARLELDSGEPDLRLLRAHLATLRNGKTFWSRTQELAGRIALVEENERDAIEAFADAVTKPDPHPELLKLAIEQYLNKSDFVSISRLLDQQAQLPPLTRLLDMGYWHDLQRRLDFAFVDAGYTDRTPAQEVAWAQMVNDDVDTDAFRTKYPDETAALVFAIREARGDDVAAAEILDALKQKRFESADLQAFVVGQAELLAGDFDRARSSLQSVSSEADVRLAAEVYAGLASKKPESKPRLSPAPVDAEFAQNSAKRMEAIMRIRRSGRNDLETARELLDSLVRSSTADINDRILYAMCLEHAGELEETKQQLIIVANQDPTARHISILVDFLLRDGRNDEAQVWIEQLEDQTGWNQSTVTLRVRWMAATDRRAEIESFVEEYARRRFALPGRSVPDEMRSIAQVYQAVGMVPQAKRWLSLLAARFPHETEPLAMLLVENDETENAIQRCVDQLNDSPSAETATLLARILVYGDVSDEITKEAKTLLDAAVKDSPNDPSLLFAIGNFELKNGNQSDAIKLLKRVTEVSPGHFLAWNNMAALLAEQAGNESQALDTIDQALDYAAYEIPHLVDTKAVVLIHQGKYEQAANLLEKKVTSSHSASDPRFFFHLAWALDKLNETERAREMLAQADGLSLSKEFLTSLETNELRQLRARLGEVQ